MTRVPTNPEEYGRDAAARQMNEAADRIREATANVAAAYRRDDPLTVDAHDPIVDALEAYVHTVDRVGRAFDVSASARVQAADGLDADGFARTLGVDKAAVAAVFAVAGYGEMEPSDAADHLRWLADDLEATAETTHAADVDGSTREGEQQ